MAGRLVTLEGAPALADLARTHLGELAIGDRVGVVTGRFADMLPDVLASRGPFDLVFIDGHHEEEAAFAYASSIRPHLAPGALVVLDDVEPTRPGPACVAASASGAPGTTARCGWGKLGVALFRFCMRPRLREPRRPPRVKRHRPSHR